MEFLTIPQIDTLDLELDTLLVVNVGSPVVLQRITAEDFLAWLVSGVEHDSLSGAGEYSHDTIDNVVEDFTLHAANTAIHCDGVVNQFPEYENGWETIETPLGTEEPGFYSKNNNGLVVIGGKCKNGATTGNIFTLPEGYRPDRRYTFAVCCSLSGGTAAGPAYINVNAAGEVTIRGTLSSNVWLSLSGIHFNVRP